MDLTSKQRRHLRALAHHLEPVVLIGGAGLTDAVAAAVDAALTRHELIKLRVDAEGPSDRHEVSDALSTRLGATSVQVIGHVVTLYRRHPTEPRISLPDLPAPAKEQRPADPKRAPSSRRRAPTQARDRRSGS